MYLKDPKTQKESVTLTMFVLGFVVVVAKLLVSGVTIGGFQMAQFTGSDFAMSVAALGTVYVMRKNSTIKPDGKE